MIARRRELLRPLAEWAAALRFEDLPADVVEEAKSQVLSVLGALYAGVGDEAAAKVLRAVRATAPAGAATLLPHGDGVRPEDAAYAHAALTMALDYDDYLFCGHTGHSAVLVPMALAEAEGRSGRDWLVAQVLANEIEGRLGAAVLIGPQNGQLWSFIHAAGAAVAAAKLRGGDARAIASALAIALYQPRVTLIDPFMASEAKVLTAGSAIVEGLRAADLALEGLAGYEGTLGGKDGFLHTLAFAPMPSLLGALGDRWLTRTLAYKIYPGCAYIDTAVDACMEIVAGGPLRPEEIASVDVAASVLTVKMDALSRPYLRGPDSLPSTLNFSVAYNVAAALVDGALGPRQLARARIADPALWAVAERVRLRHDPRWTVRMRSGIGEWVSMKELFANLKPEILPWLWRHAEGAGLGDVARALGRSVRRPRALLAAGAAGAGDVEGAGGFRLSFGATVDLRTRDGRRLRASAEVPLGGAGRPADERRRLAARKFLREAADRGVDKGAAERVHARIEALDGADADGVRDLCRGLAAGRDEG